MSIPLYQRIIDHITSEIRDHDLQPNDQLPSEAELGRLFSASRITVTRALKELELTGVIYRVKGKGSFVAAGSQPDSRVIALIIPHRADYFSGGDQYVRSVSRYSQEAGLLCSIHYSEQSIRREREILQHLSKQAVGGIILYPISNANIDLISGFMVRQVPLVILDRQLEELPCSVVESDNSAGGHAAVSYLLKVGHKRIAFAGHLESEAAEARYQGYCQALIEARIPLDRSIVYQEFQSLADRDLQPLLAPSEISRIVKLISAADPPVTAVFCVNDLLAYHLMTEAEGSGLAVPGQLSILGFDNLPFIRDLSPALTTVEQDFDTIGRRCVRTLVNKMGDTPESPSTVRVATSLIIRESVADLR